MNEKATKSEQDLTDQKTEAVVGVFSDPNAAERAIDRLREINLEFAKIQAGRNGNEVSSASKGSEGLDSMATGSSVQSLDDLRNLFFSDTHAVDAPDVLTGIAKGAAIGAASGLLFVAVPVVGLVAPLGGMLGGALIGGMAGIDEANRHAELPTIDDYRRIISSGKALVIVPGDESFRTRVANELKSMKAEAVHQHPPIGHAVKQPHAEQDDTESKTG